MCVLGQPGAEIVENVAPGEKLTGRPTGRTTKAHSAGPPFSIGSAVTFEQTTTVAAER